MKNLWICLIVLLGSLLPGLSVSSEVDILGDGLLISPNPDSEYGILKLVSNGELLQELRIDPAETTALSFDELIPDGQDGDYVFLINYAPFVVGMQPADAGEQAFGHSMVPVTVGKGSVEWGRFRLEDGFAIVDREMDETEGEVR